MPDVRGWVCAAFIVLLIRLPVAAAEVAYTDEEHHGERSLLVDVRYVDGDITLVSGEVHLESLREIVPLIERGIAERRCNNLVSLRMGEGVDHRVLTYLVLQLPPRIYPGFIGGVEMAAQVQTYLERVCAEAQAQMVKDIGFDGTFDQLASGTPLHGEMVEHLMRTIVARDLLRQPP